MGLVFVLGGALLSVIAFVPQQKKEWTYDLHRSSKTPVVGPLLVCIGVILFLAGTSLCVINKKLRIGGKLIKRDNLYETFSNNSTFSNVQTQVQQQSPDRCFSITQNSLTLESLTEVVRRHSCPAVEEKAENRESSLVEIKEKISKDIACFPTSPIVEQKMTKKTKTTKPLFLDVLKIPEIYITQPSPIPRLQSYAKIKKRTRNSFRLRHKVDHDIGASKEVIEIPTTRRASFHGDSLESIEIRPRSTSPKSLPLIISLFDTNLTAKSKDHSPEPDSRGSIDDKEWIWAERSGSPSVDTDSIRINLDKLQN